MAQQKIYKENGVYVFYTDPVTGKLTEKSEVANRRTSPNLSALENSGLNIGAYELVDLTPQNDKVAPEVSEADLIMYGVAVAGDKFDKAISAFKGEKMGADYNTATGLNLSKSDREIDFIVSYTEKLVVCDGEDSYLLGMEEGAKYFAPHLLDKMATLKTKYLGGEYGN